MLCQILGALTVAHAAACTSGSGLAEPTISEIEPASAIEGQSVVMNIRGDGFVRRIRTDFSGGATTIEPIAVWIGTERLTDVIVHSDKLLEIEVPSTLALGTYDILVDLDPDRRARLDDGFEVFDMCGADNTCADGCCGGDEDAANCPTDCPPQCSDGLCTNLEDTCNCDADCGTMCGDGCCNGDEDETTCPDDCATTCGDGMCTGSENVINCFNDCASTCDADCGTCGASECCIEPCTGDCSPECRGDCTCVFGCANNQDTCAPTCRQDATCELNCTDAENCSLTCVGNSTCIVDCTRANICNGFECLGDASCQLNCTDANNCGFANCTGTETDCGNGILVCNRPCPPAP